MTAQIDMGASVNTIKATIVLRESFHIKINSVLEGFGNKTVESPGIVNEIFVMESLKPKLMTFRVVPDDVQTVDVILGRPLTESQDLSL